MRIVLLLVLISVTITTTAQDNLSKQLQLIIKDSSTNFRKIKGTLKSFFMDSVFNSTLTIEGTKSNELQYSPYSAMYSANIIDSSTTEIVTKLFDQWMSKLTKALGPSFKSSEGQPAQGFGASYVKSNVFVHGSLHISLNHSLNIFNNKLHEMSLNISYRFPSNSKWDEILRH